MGIYYAHSMKIYNTERELTEFQFLVKKFGDVDNPNDGKGKRSMDHFLKRAMNASIVVCSEFQKYIGRGVYEELTVAFSSTIPCFVLRKRRIFGSYQLKPIKKLKIIDSNDWKIKYGKVVV